MSVYVAAGDFGGFTSNHTGQPTTTPGTSITPAQNTYGSYTQVLSALSNDVYAIKIMVSNVGISTVARDCLIDIGIDTAGGTSYTSKITDLMCSCAGVADSTSGVVEYYFPIFIKAGSTVAVKASVNSTNLTAFSVWVVVFNRPKVPVKAGHYVTAVGANAGTSSGTAVTSGTTSEGTWTSLGTPTKSHWYWQLGFGVNSAAMTTNTFFADLAFGDGSNKIVILSDVPIATVSTEIVSKLLFTVNCYCYVPSGVEIFGRLQCSGTPDSNLSLIAYGVGG